MGGEGRGGWGLANRRRRLARGGTAERGRARRSVRREIRCATSRFLHALAQGFGLTKADVTPGLRRMVFGATRTLPESGFNCRSHGLDPGGALGARGGAVASAQLIALHCGNLTSNDRNGWQGDQLFEYE